MRGTMIPKTFFSKLSEKSPFIIFDNRLYQIGEGDGKDGFMKIGKHKFGLFQGPDLADLERFYSDLHSKEIFEHKRAFIKDRLKQEIKSNQDMQKYLNNNNVLGFILYEVFPFFIEDKSEIKALLKGKKSKKEKSENGIGKIVKDAMSKEDRGIEVAQVREELLKELRSPKPKEPKISSGEEDKEVDSLLTDYYEKIGILSKSPLYKKHKKKSSQLSLDTELSKILNNDVLIIKGLVYRLSHFKEEQRIYVRIRGQDYSLVPFSSVREVEHAYRNKLDTQFKIQAINEFEDQINKIKKLRSEKKALEKFFEKKEYDAGTVGFKKHDGAYYVYVPVPEYVLKDPDTNKYYRFDKCRVAVKVKYDGKRFNYGSPRVIDSYFHPFLPDSNCSWQSICMGNYNYSKLGMLDDASAIATLLSDARNVLLTGYKLDCSPYHKLGEYTSREISIEEIKKRKLPVTNVRNDKSFLEKIKGMVKTVF